MQEEVEISCPYCGEPIDLLIDTSVDRQTYIEDCSVCCRPITIQVTTEEGEITGIEAIQS